MKRESSHVTEVLSRKNVATWQSAATAESAVSSGSSVLRMAMMMPKRSDVARRRLCGAARRRERALKVAGVRLAETTSQAFARSV